MTPQIKQRIEQIRCAEVPEGYIRAGQAIIPDGWERSTFAELGIIASGLVDSKYEPYLHMQHIGPENIEKDTGRILNTCSANELGLISGKFYFDSESIVYSKIRPNLNKVCAPSFEGICSADCYSIKPRSVIRKHYLQYLMLSYDFYKRAVACSMRTGMPKINQDDLNCIPMCYPLSIQEQMRIEKILLTQSRLISLKEKLIEEKKRQKKYLIQHLLTGKKRLPGFGGEWSSVLFKECITEVDDRSTESNQHPILSVTKDGIVYQADHFNKQIASDNNIGYKIIKRNQLAFSILNLWMGSVDVLTLCDVGIVSPAYKVFECVEKNLIPSFAKYFLRSYNVIWLYNINSETGASVVRKNLDLAALLNEKLEIPPIDEQGAIAKVLSTADAEIELLQKDLGQEKQKKKALMQLLLTGIVRV